VRNISLSLLCLLWCAVAFAGIPGEKIVIAIAGEAEGLSIHEQQAIAGAILNRGSLKGVYGYDRLLGVELGLKTRQTAQKALNQARIRDVSNGATHWLSNWDLKHCKPSLIAWRKKMRVTARTEHFTFYA
jgi:hypothetical protein